GRRLQRREGQPVPRVVPDGDVPVDEVLTSVRLACGGTLGAARETLRTRVPAVNLLGGFHHAAPGAAGGFCPVNDMAVAIATLRAEGFAGRAVVLDLDAHPPDGTAACLARDRNSWIGSLSGSDWGRLERADETVLPEGTGDAEYLKALSALLGRMPRPKLAFVVAGGDVLAGDRLGMLGLSLRGARERDLAVASALRGVPSVWLPGGGYHRDAWRVLAGSAMALALRSREAIPEGYDPISARFARVSTLIAPDRLGEWGRITQEDVEENLGLGRPHQRLLLGFYTAAGVEHALFRYGLLDPLERFGYRQFRAELDATGAGERVRLFGRAGGEEHLLIELVLEKRRVAGVEVLFIHWMSLRNPRAQFSEKRPRLPGQEVPGLGLARELGTILARMAVRLGLAGVAYRPAHFHTAYAARHQFAFVNPARQGRFEALIRDLAHLSLREATAAMDEGRVRMNGEPYAWEADEMAFWLQDRPPGPGGAERERARERVRFTVEPARPGGGGEAG
ncbi:MAG TPA: histone deacetylase, partial [Anaeromyxobacteraceae bacterium]|nr:histone deacetylase [Anaeromyxobacteraceae bacterium]